MVPQTVENYEYEMPSDFEDEEIDEDSAFTAEDKRLYAEWFPPSEDEDGEFDDPYGLIEKGSEGEEEEEEDEEHDDMGEEEGEEEDDEDGKPAVMDW